MLFTLFFVYPNIFCAHKSINLYQSADFKCERMQILVQKYRTPESALYARIKSNQPHAPEDVALLVKNQAVLNLYRNFTITKKKTGKQWRGDLFAFARKIEKPEVVELLEQRIRVDDIKRKNNCIVRAIWAITSEDLNFVYTHYGPLYSNETISYQYMFSLPKSLFFSTKLQAYKRALYEQILAYIQIAPLISCIVRYASRQIKNPLGV